MRGLAPLLIVLAFVLVLVALSNIPLRHIAKNFGLTLPFVGFASLTVLLTSGTDVALVMFVRISCSVILLLMLVSSTPFFKMLSFIFLFLDEMARMRTARIARGFNGGRNLFDKRAFKTLGATIGMTFVRANGRATNIYDALLLRGYSGDIHSFDRGRTRPRDLLLVGVFACVGIMAILLETKVMTWMH